MRKVKLILGLVVLAVAIIAGWQIASCELANVELRDDLRDLAGQTGAHIGLVPFKTDEDFRNVVIREAKKYGIQLEPGQVTVQRAGTPQVPIMYLAADYKVPVTLPGYSFTLHFHPSSAK
jgi:hypothetical protein